MAELQEQLESYDYYRADDILKGIVERMGIKDGLLKTQLEYLSGGEKSKIAFARVLYANPEILLLDEPTNHLDPETQAIIGENFNEYSGTIIVVSHNSSFVEQIGISRMLALPTGRTDRYKIRLSGGRVRGMQHPAGRSVGEFLHACNGTAGRMQCHDDRGIRANIRVSCDK